MSFTAATGLVPSYIIFMAFGRGVKAQGAKHQEFSRAELSQCDLGVEKSQLLCRSPSPATAQSDFYLLPALERLKSKYYCGSLENLETDVKNQAWKLAEYKPTNLTVAVPRIPPAIQAPLHQEQQFLSISHPPL